MIIDILIFIAVGVGLLWFTLSWAAGTNEKNDVETNDAGEGIQYDKEN